MSNRTSSPTSGRKRVIPKSERLNDARNAPPQTRLANDAKRDVLADEALDGQAQRTLDAVQPQAAVDRDEPVAVEHEALARVADLGECGGVEELVGAQDGVDRSIAGVDRVRIDGDDRRCRSSRPRRIAR